MGDDLSSFNKQSGCCDGWG